MIMEIHNRDKRYGKHKIWRYIETNNFIHPQASRIRRPPPLGIFLGTHVFYILKSNIKIHSQRQKSKGLHL